MKNILYLCLALAASLATFAADPLDDAKAVQGDWKPVKAELAGQPMPEAVLKTISLKLDNGKYEVFVGASPDRGTYKLDSAAKPKDMTITGTEGPNHGKTFPAIYELKGDTLRICYDLSGHLCLSVLGATDIMKALGIPSLPAQIATFACLFLLAVRAHAATVFADDFKSGPSELWGNEAGHWIATGAGYSARAPNNEPAAFSSLPFALGDFSVDFDITDVMDGGIYLRSNPEPQTPLGISGVLLNLKIPDGGPKIYWHVMTNGVDCSPPLNVAFVPYGRNPHVHIEVSGNTYSAFVNGSSRPATTLTTPLFGCGRVALYNFSHQGFRNVVIRALPKQSAKPAGRAAQMTAFADNRAADTDRGQAKWSRAQIR